MTRDRRTITAADLFCGAGGASNGLVRAVLALGLDLELLAVNHWKTAVTTHETNHPLVSHDGRIRTRHKCERLERVNPREEVPGGELDILLAGPECTHHSTALGGRPINDQSRATAWCILKWAQELYIRTILIENVPEFQTWGPLGSNMRPLKSRKGETYRAFLDAIRSLGYTVQARVLNAADYGDPTTRKRLFILCQRGRKRVQFPAATHSKHPGQQKLFGLTQKWRAAREVIDWSIEGQSIFDRKTPLAPATMSRIVAGLERFGGPELKPFLVVLRQHMGARSVDAPLPSVEDPLPTLTARANQYLVEPFVLSQQSGGAPRSTEQPLPTVATDGAIQLIEPFLVPYYTERPEERHARTKSVDEPFPTITASGGGKLGVVEPFLVPMYGERPTQEPRTHSVDEPVPTIPATGGGKFGVVESFIVTPGGANLRRPRSTNDPLPTVTGSDRFAVVEPFIVDAAHGNDAKSGSPGSRTKSLDEPLGTLTGSNRFAIAEPYLVQTSERRDVRVDSVDEPVRTITAAAGRCIGLAEPVIVKYNGTAKSGQSLEDPLDTVTGRDRFGLAQPVIDGQMLDIRFRMLQPHELAQAMSFPRDYQFTGNRGDVVKQIGNAWAGETARALCFEILTPYATATRNAKTA